MIEKKMANRGYYELYVFHGFSWNYVHKYETRPKLYYKQTLG